MSVHSKFSPSGSGRWLNCPGSIKLIDTISVKDESNFYAEEGTAAHELLEKCLKTKQDAVFYLGDTFNKFEVSREMATAVQQALNYIHKFVNHTTIEIYPERWFSLSFLEEHMGGTCDVTIINETELHIMDYKHGRGVPVDVENNTQLMLYAMGAIQELNLHHYKTFHLHILQPRCPHDDGPMRHIEYPMELLRDFAKTVRTKVAEACSDKPMFRAGEKQCRWCPAAPICKEHTRFNLNLAQAEFEDFFEKEHLDAVNPSTISFEMISIILQNAKVIESWLKSVKEYAINRLHEGQDIPYYKLVYGRSNRIWKDDPVELSKKLQEMFEFEEDDIQTVKVKTPAQIDALLTADQKEEARALWTKPQGNVTLAPKSSNKPAITKDMDAMADFNNV